jgi:molybdenum cofactor cytidylyltransferase
MTGIIILAAGSSSRLGQPKQNLVFKGKTLLQRAIETAVASVCEPVIVVLGANAEVIEPTIKYYKVNIVYNAGWNEGMSSAIRTGISALIKTDPKIQSAILMLCDQLLMDTYVLNHLIMANNAGGIAASGYNDTIGPPVLFDVIYFNDLLALKGSDGAKKVIQQYPGKIVNVLFPQGDIDIDTMEDFQKLSQL